MAEADAHAEGAYDTPRVEGQVSPTCALLSVPAAPLHTWRCQHHTTPSQGPSPATTHSTAAPRKHFMAAPDKHNMAVPVNKLWQQSMSQVQQQRMHTAAQQTTLSMHNSIAANGPCCAHQVLLAAHCCLHSPVTAHPLLTLTYSTPSMVMVTLSLVMAV